jgi:hypothetical protein
MERKGTPQSNYLWGVLTNSLESAFPVLDATRANLDGSPYSDYACSDPGMTLTQYAAIHLKVPRSGDPDIDAMIRKSRRGRNETL